MIKRFPDNARVAFIGDSITAANLSLQWIIRAYSRAGAKGMRFFNCGVAGGTADFAVTGYFEDIRRYNPTHAVISFGINDSNRDVLLWHRDEKRLELLIAAYEKYKRRLSELVDILLEDGVDVTLCTPVPYDEYMDSEQKPLPGGFALMLGYAEYVRELAGAKGVQLYDQHKIISGVMAREAVFSPDRIHPTPHGYYVLAREMLREQGIDVGREDAFPDCFAEWNSYVARLRKVLATECMIIPRTGVKFDGPTDIKLQKMQWIIDHSEWGVPVFESFCRAYAEDKPHEAELYKLVDETYEVIFNSLF
jgi:hypothetical protein